MKLIVDNFSELEPKKYKRRPQPAQAALAPADLELRVGEKTITAKRGQMIVFFLGEFHVLDYKEFAEKYARVQGPRAQKVAVATAQSDGD